MTDESIVKIKIEIRMLKDLIKINRIKKKNQQMEIVTFNKKKFRFSDWFAEKVIKAVAFLSIAVVILIFIFVFREAFPIFKMDKKEAVNN